MKAKILVFDKFLSYKTGGAQLSLNTLLSSFPNNDFKYLGCEVKKSFSAGRLEESPFSVEKIKIREIPRFPYLEYCLNKRRIKKVVKKERADLLIVQGFWAPLALNNFSGPKIYLIRDEFNLNEIKNYYSGFKALLKKLYLFFQRPFLRVIFKDNRKAIKESGLVVANSQFIKRRLKEKFNKDSEVIYPLINAERLKRENIPPFDQRKFITLIGSKIIKGKPVVEKIAWRMKDRKFMIVGRNFKKPFWKNNIYYYPWQKDSLDIYKKSKIVLTPSLWNEAFCRVGVESMALGIPCLGSNKGGIPEVLGERFIIKDIWNIDNWGEKIKWVEKNYKKFDLKERSLKFDQRRQIEKFKEIVKNNFNIEL